MLAACEWWTLTYGKWDRQGRPLFTIAVLPALYCSDLAKEVAPPLSPLTQRRSCPWISSGLCFTLTKTELNIRYAQWKRYTELTYCQSKRAFAWMSWEVDLHTYSTGFCDLWGDFLLPCFFTVSSTLTFSLSFFTSAHNLPLAFPTKTRFA